MFRGLPLLGRRSGSRTHAPKLSKRARARLRMKQHDRLLKSVRKATRKGVKGVHGEPMSTRRLRKESFERDGGPKRYARFLEEGPLAMLEPSPDELALLAAYDEQEEDKEEWDQLAYAFQYGEPLEITDGLKKRYIALLESGEDNLVMLPEEVSGLRHINYFLI